METNGVPPGEASQFSTQEKSSYTSEIIWAKMGSFCPWPARRCSAFEAKQLREVQPTKLVDAVPVLFLGIKRERAWITKNNVSLLDLKTWSTKFDKRRFKSDKDYRAAIIEAVRVSQLNFPEETVKLVFEANSKEFAPTVFCSDCGGSNCSGSLITCDSCEDNYLHWHCFRSHDIDSVAHGWVCDLCCMDRGVPCGTTYPIEVEPSPPKVSSRSPFDIDADLDKPGISNVDTKPVSSASKRRQSSGSNGQSKSGSKDVSTASHSATTTNTARGQGGNNSQNNNSRSRNSAAIVATPEKSTDATTSRKLSDTDVDDLCYVCQGNGEVLLCDYPQCRKVYHQACVLKVSSAVHNSLDVGRSGDWHDARTGRQVVHPAGNSEWFCPRHFCVDCGALETLTTDNDPPLLSLPLPAALYRQEEIKQSSLKACEHCPFALCLNCDRRLTQQVQRSSFATDVDEQVDTTKMLQLFVPKGSSAGDAQPVSTRIALPRLARQVQRSDGAAPVDVNPHSDSAVKSNGRAGHGSASTVGNVHNETHDQKKSGSDEATIANSSSSATSPKSTITISYSCRICVLLGFEGHAAHHNAELLAHLDSSDLLPTALQLRTRHGLARVLEQCWSAMCTTRLALPFLRPLLPLTSTFTTGSNVHQHHSKSPQESKHAGKSSHVTIEGDQVAELVSTTLEPMDDDTNEINLQPSQASSATVLAQQAADGNGSTKEVDVMIRAEEEAPVDLLNLLERIHALHYHSIDQFRLDLSRLRQRLVQRLSQLSTADHNTDEVQDDAYGASTSSTNKASSTSRQWANSVSAAEKEAALQKSRKRYLLMAFDSIMHTMVHVLGGRERAWNQQHPPILSPLCAVKDVELKREQAVDVALCTLWRLPLHTSFVHMHSQQHHQQQQLRHRIRHPLTEALQHVLGVMESKAQTNTSTSDATWASRDLLQRSARFMQERYYFHGHERCSNRSTNRDDAVDSSSSDPKDLDHYESASSLSTSSSFTEGWAKGGRNENPCLPLVAPRSLSTWIAHVCAGDVKARCVYLTDDEEDGVGEEAEHAAQGQQTKKRRSLVPRGAHDITSTQHARHLVRQLLAFDAQPGDEKGEEDDEDEDGDVSQLDTFAIAQQMLAMKHVHDPRALNEDVTLPFPHTTPAAGRPLYPPEDLANFSHVQQLMLPAHSHLISPANYSTSLSSSSNALYTLQRLQELTQQMHQLHAHLQHDLTQQIQQPHLLHSLLEVPRPQPHAYSSSRSSSGGPSTSQSSRLTMNAQRKGSLHPSNHQQNNDTGDNYSVSPAEIVPLGHVPVLAELKLANDHLRWQLNQRDALLVEAQQQCQSLQRQVHMQQMRIAQLELQLPSSMETVDSNLGSSESDRRGRQSIRSSSAATIEPSSTGGGGGRGVLKRVRERSRSRRNGEDAVEGDIEEVVDEGENASTDLKTQSRLDDGNDIVDGDRKGKGAQQTSSGSKKRRR